MRYEHLICKKCEREPRQNGSSRCKKCSEQYRVQQFNAKRLERRIESAKGKQNGKE